MQGSSVHTRICLYLFLTLIAIPEVMVKTIFSGTGQCILPSGKHARGPRNNNWKP